MGIEELPQKTDKKEEEEPITESPEEELREPVIIEQTSKKEIVAAEKTILSRFRGMAREIGGALVLISTLASFPGAQRPRGSEPYKTATEEFLERGDLEKFDFSIMADRDPEGLLEHFEQWKGLPYANDVLKTIAKTHPSHILEAAEKLRGADNFDGLLREAMQNARGSWYILAYFKAIEHLPEARELLKQEILHEANQGYGNVLSQWELFKDEPYADEALDKLARNNPRAIIDNIKEVHLRLTPRVMTEIVETLIKSSPETLVYKYENYEDLLPDSARILQRAVQSSLAKKSVGGIMYGYKDFRELPFARQALEDAMVIIQKDTEHSYRRHLSELLNLEELKDASNYEETLEKHIRAGAANNDWEILNRFDSIRNEPYAEEILERFARNMPTETLPYVKDLKNLPYIQRIVELALDARPRLVLDYMRAGYSRLPVEPSVVQKAIDRTIIEDPLEAFRFIERSLNYPGSEEIVKKTARAVAVKDPARILNMFPRYSKEPELRELIKEAFDNTLRADPRDVLSALRFHPTSYDDFVDRKALVKQAVFSILYRDPYTALIYSDLYKNEPYAKEIFQLLLDRSPSEIISQKDTIEKIPGGKDLFRRALAKLMTGSSRNPLPLYEQWKDEPEAEQLFDKALRTNPGYALKQLDYFGSPVIDAIRGSKHPVAQILKELRENGHTGVEAAALTDALLSGEIAISDVDRILANQKEYFNKLVAIKLKKNPVGEVTVEEALRGVALKAVYAINARHEEPDKKRFASVDNASPEELYVMMTYGEEEIFTSSFNGLYNRMLDGMKRGNIGGTKLLARIGYDHFRTFIKMAAGFNRLGEFLSTMDSKDQQELLERFVGGIEKEKEPLSHAVAIADTFNVIQDKNVLRVFQETIKGEYERVKGEGSKEGVAMYGLLAGMFGNHAEVDEPWLKEMAEKYHLPDVTHLTSVDLFNRDGTNVQEYFFYDDADGKNTFKSFVAQYRNTSGWEVEDRGTYVHISTRGRHTRTIEIFANKPEEESRGPEDIKKILDERKIETIVVVHRGHSYHAEKTIARIPPIAKIVSLGSCGGYRNVEEILKKAPEAHIISTKGTGAHVVNEPLFKMLNEKIRADGEIQWPNFWKEAEQKLSNKKEFGNYVPPHKNLGVLYLKAYYQLLQEK